MCQKKARARHVPYTLGDIGRLRVALDKPRNIASRMGRQEHALEVRLVHSAATRPSSKRRATHW